MYDSLTRARNQRSSFSTHSCSYKLAEFATFPSLQACIYVLSTCITTVQYSPSLWNPSSCSHTTAASSLSKRVSQTLPQALLMHISTLPSLVPACMSSLLPTNLSSPSLQFPVGVEIAVEGTDNIKAIKHAMHLMTSIHTYLHPTLADYCSNFCRSTTVWSAVLALQQIGLRSLTVHITQYMRKTGFTEGTSGHSNCTCNGQNVYYVII